MKLDQATLDDHLVIDHDHHSRNTQYATFNAICP